jgi:hypothetical protein
MATDEPRIEPLMTDQPEDEEELRARRRAVREEADQDIAIRTAAVSGALGGNAGAAPGGIIGRGGALGVEETIAEEDAIEEGREPKDASDGEDGRGAGRKPGR